jgi:hypothetical protein
LRGACPRLDNAKLPARINMTLDCRSNKEI